MLDNFGTLSVRAYTAGGALPVPDALVRILGAEEENRFVSNTVFTDIDGKTPTVSLPAPPASYSLSPSPPMSPYAIYDVEISADGYYSKRVLGVPIYPGIYSVLPVNMIPQGEYIIEDYPRGNVNAQIPPPNL